MSFTKDKVAIVTGGCSGIGLAIVISLIKGKAKGITVTDVNPNGQEIVSELREEHKNPNIIFVKADVSIKEELEKAFSETISTFKQLDILVNNAGILNDVTWEKEIAINLNGTIHGCLLAIHDYIPKYKSGDEGVIINLSSTAGLQGFPNIPIYSSTKHAIIGLTRGWGHEKHYSETKIRVMAVCPDATSTPLFTTMSGKHLGERYKKIFNESALPEVQSPEDVARAVLHMIDNGKSGSIWVVQERKFGEINLPNVEDLFSNFK